MAVGAEDAARLGRFPEDDEFITGNGLASHCGHVLNYGPLASNPSGAPDWWFCKADRIEELFELHAPQAPFVLFTHNSDRAVGRDARRHLRRRALRAWFATNVELDHPRLHPIPIGIANPAWPHGDAATFRRVRGAPPPKTKLVDVSFSVATNPAERRRCLEAAGVEPEPPRPFPDYLAGLAGSYFCLAPEGNGIDTHRVWEALYVGTVPVVTRSLLTDRHPDLPLVVLGGWPELASVELSPDLHERLWRGFDPASLWLDRYLERIRATVEGGPGTRLATM
jgi:hypothetical protein